MFDQIRSLLMDPWVNGLVVGLLTLWPAMRILRRAGQPPALALLVFVPLVGFLALLALLALRRWPAAQPPGESPG